MSPAEIKQAVDAVLAAAQLPVSPEEYERLVRNYPLVVEQVGELRLPETELRNLEPAVIYPA